jgi:hypothetical protein
MIKVTIEIGYDGRWTEESTYVADSVEYLGQTIVITMGDTTVLESIAPVKSPYSAGDTRRRAVVKKLVQVPS